MFAKVGDLSVAKLARFGDERGVLVPVEMRHHVPFQVTRMFWIHGVPVGQVRGAHAHKLCHQFMICAVGRVQIDTFDGEAERSIALTAGEALHVPPGIFSAEKFENTESILIVLCDRPYEPDDYLPDKMSLVHFRQGPTA